MNHKMPQYTKSKFKNVLLLFYLLWQYWNSLAQAVISNHDSPAFMVKYLVFCRSRDSFEPQLLPPDALWNSCPGLELNWSGWSCLLPLCCLERHLRSMVSCGNLHSSEVAVWVLGLKKKRHVHLLEQHIRQQSQSVQEILQCIYKPATVQNSCMNCKTHQLLQLVCKSTGKVSTQYRSLLPPKQPSRCSCSSPITNLRWKLLLTCLKRSGCFNSIQIMLQQIYNTYIFQTLLVIHLLKPITFSLRAQETSASHQLLAVAMPGYLCVPW